MCYQPKKLFLSNARSRKMRISPTVLREHSRHLYALKGAKMTRCSLVCVEMVLLGLLMPRVLIKKDNGYCCARSSYVYLTVLSKAFFHLLKSFGRHIQY